jgi:hypothetical protein
VDRALSAYTYPCHNPNEYCDGQYSEVGEELPAAARISLEAYVQMPEHRDVATKMLGAGLPPYAKARVDQGVYAKAVEAVQRASVIMLTEDLNSSVAALKEFWNVPQQEPLELPRERRQASSLARDGSIRQNRTLVRHIQHHNEFDHRLYHLALAQFCAQLQDRGLPTSHLCRRPA